MPNSDLYPTDLTPEEIDLGFQLVFISNPSRSFYGNPSLMRAVIYAVGAMDIIVKTRHPDGKVEYSHRQYGNLANEDQADWLPVLVSTPSAADAIRFAKKRLDKQIARQEGLGINSEFPSLDLHCPDCNHYFSIQKDYLGIEESIACPSCKKANAASEMVSFEPVY